MPFNPFAFFWLTWAACVRTAIQMTPANVLLGAVIEGSLDGALRPQKKDAEK